MAEHPPMFTPLIRLPNQLKDVPSGIEGVTLTDVVTPEYAKSTIPCKKFTWILDATPRIELDFGPDTKKFQFHIESSQFDLFKIDKDVSFERTATHSIFRVRKIDRNPPSRIKLLEEYTMKYWTLLRTEKCEVRFNMFQKYDFEECFIWKLTKKFSVVYFSTQHDVIFTPNQLRFLLEDITSDYLRLPEIKFTAPIKKSEKKLKPIKHETMDIYAKFLPFIYFINMECKKVKARSENVKAWDLNTFLKAWIGGKKLQNLQSFTFYYSDMVKPLAYEDVLNNIHSETGKARNFEKVPEINVSEQTKNEEVDFGREIQRSTDGIKANVFIFPTCFIFKVKRDEC
ncbi:hypothetical protein L5515_019246 [Caenorhabditis briggsae]|uniref:Sdz-33 F-box domain-containing protein n=1 Tax=Caenorhabditis briggsae TaxID=6238 RepID=A0AAE9FP02_CAEBR|nr:hypothetical protein L5515_019246 [Caenorhabditis briggsae]